LNYQIEDGKDDIFLLIVIIIVTFALAIFKMIGFSQWISLICLLASLICTVVYLISFKICSEEKREKRRKELKNGLKFSAVIGALFLFWTIFVYFEQNI
jgi:1,4-dihydroxy-2-naphthoate octaprenyltransferase